MYLIAINIVIFTHIKIATFPSLGKYFITNIWLRSSSRLIFLGQVQGLNKFKLCQAQWTRTEKVIIHTYAIAQNKIITSQAIDYNYTLPRHPK